MKIKKYIFNWFVFIWMSFGLLLYLYTAIDMMFQKDRVMQMESLDRFTFVLVFIILLLYPIAFFKYKSSNKGKS